ncbi:Adenylosuccinate synthetase protein [Marine Group I thaumarchaeote SCGC AAA799-E16]|uniref:Adenylosuccinate synthetase n=4 Tax=Marine Group I TaxID=905826 RepID=A0A081RNJ7_9ARCH|nr:Adenylosuccinate synthetase protein [Marine Group I thaumarchaeote SCGC AAA799-N04]KER06296.1 Adenylosuccinate synthetase protein [Marine Group I thaumarchaeote SCGC AAA799-E16]KFM15478.1 Adenylosuccinate synthetase protein [Marine Group I thaumarchaeote SCGC AAA799-D11]KFM16720.1 Adenylosuccinate synthetase protein [Marine Group I thaumarchaeote SCGC RSA3]
MTSTVVVGGFFGDEGKGKIISYLAIKDNPKVIVRGGAGPNAGHTIKDGDKVYKVRMLPSGFLNKDAKVMIGPGVVINPEVLQKEIDDFGVTGRAFIDKHCGVIEGTHLARDSKGELKEKIGSTGSGTGPANADRAMRVLRLAKDFDSLSSLITDVPAEVNSALDKNENVLVEGTQGTFLSLWHGTYPFVTSKDVTASGICADIGLGPTKVDEVIVVFKSYVTRVGTGPLDKELSLEEAEKKGWSEFGTVTGRQRRAADFDFDLARRAIMLNGATQISITKLDVLFADCAGKTLYDELSEDAKAFIKNIEDELNTPVTIIGTGPTVNDVIDRRN